MRPLSHAVPAVVKELLRAAPLSNGKVDFAWRAAVGPAFERVTAVKLDGSVLFVDTQSAEWTRELLRLSSTILERLRAYLGTETVSRIEVRTNPHFQAPGVGL